MYTKTGKIRITLAGNTKDIFRLIQSIPSKKAEPFKLWLAKVGYERIKEIEKKTGKEVVTKENYLQKTEKQKRIEKRKELTEKKN